MTRIPARSLVVLVGPSGAGKSTWAAGQFRPDQVVSSDALRGVVGTGPYDQRAGSDAFDLLDMIVERRLKRGLLTVIDTLGLDPEKRAAWQQAGRQHGFQTHAVVFDTPADVCKTRNRGRPQPVPAKVLADQISGAAKARAEIAGEGFDGVHPPEEVDVVATGLEHPGHVLRTGLRFGLHISSFQAGAGFADRLAETARVAERVGFQSIWVMDHLMQIPQVGRPWDDMPESWTTIAWLAAHTSTARLGVLVSPVTFRNPAHLAKIVATADVLSGGRITCGLGLGWWAEEHRRYGWTLPPVEERYRMLEDALELLPLMWGPGSPSFRGRTIEVTEAVCYPRPLQEHVPILVGGSGPRTLRLAAERADACNLFGPPEKVAKAAERLKGRVEITHLSTAVAERSGRELSATVDRLGQGGPPELQLDRLGAGTVEQQVERYSALAEAGVETAIVALPDAATPGALEAFGGVIAALTPR